MPSGRPPYRKLFTNPENGCEKQRSVKFITWSRGIKESHPDICHPSQLPGSYPRDGATRCIGMLSYMTWLRIVFYIRKNPNRTALNEKMPSVYIFTALYSIIYTTPVNLDFSFFYIIPSLN